MLHFLIEHFRCSLMLHFLISFEQFWRLFKLDELLTDFESFWFMQIIFELFGFKSKVLKFEYRSFVSVWLLDISSSEASSEASSFSQSLFIDWLALEWLGLELLSPLLEFLRSLNSCLVCMFGWWNSLHEGKMHSFLYSQEAYLCPVLRHEPQAWCLATWHFLNSIV